MMSKAMLFLAALMSALVLLFSGCGNQSMASSSRVKLLHYFTGSLSAGIDQLATTVNTEKSGFLMEATPMEHESFKSAIRVQLEGPNPPDLFSYWAGAKTQNLVDRGAVAPIGDLFGTVIPNDSFSPTVLNSLVYSGHQYMIPITRHYVGFFYSTKIFRDAGVKVPKTWDEFRSLCLTLKAKGYEALTLGARNRWPAQFWFDYLLLRQSGFDWRQNLMAGKHTYTDSPVRQAFATWKELFDAGLFNADAGSLDWDAAAFRVAEGKSAMTLNGTWLIGGFTDKGFKYPDDYGFFAFPDLGLATETTALGPIDGILLSAASRHPEAARKVLARMAEVEPQAAFSLAAGSISPQQGVPGDRLPPLQQDIKKIIDASTHWAFNFDLATSPEYSEIGLDQLLAFVRKPADLDAILAGWDQKLASLTAK